MPVRTTETAVSNAIRDGSGHSDAIRSGLHVLATRIDEVERVEDRLAVVPQLLPRGLI